MRACFGGRREVRAPGATVGEVFQNLLQEHPRSRWHLFSRDDELHAFLGVYLNGEDVRFKDGLDTPVKTGDQLDLVPTSGGG